VTSAADGTREPIIIPKKIHKKKLPKDFWFFKICSIIELLNAIVIAGYAPPFIALLFAFASVCEVVSMAISIYLEGTKSSTS
jgi:hypothetical protein